MQPRVFGGLGFADIDDEQLTIKEDSEIVQPNKVIESAKVSAKKSTGKAGAAVKKV